MPLTLTEKIWICKHTSALLKREGAHSKMILSFHQFIWKNLPAGVQLLWPIKLAAVALLYTAAQRQNIWSFWETKDKIINPSRSPGCVELKPPSLRCSWERTHLDFSCIVYSRLIFCFLVFGEGKVGKGKYLWIRFRICYPFCVSVSVLSFLSLPSSCIHVQNAEWEQADPTAVAYLPVSTSWGGRMEFRLINYPEFWHLF